MNYRELRDELFSLTEEQLNADVTIYLQDNDEFYAVSDTFKFSVYEDCDVLDPGHPYLTI